VDAVNPAGPDGLWRTGDDGLRLQTGSPCIDAGLAAGAPLTDILGNPRVGAPDIGAYEFFTINIIQPLAGAILLPRSQVDIIWDSQGAGPTVNIHFTSNGGNTWSTIPNVPNQDGRNTYRWTVPDISSTKCFLAIWSNYYNVFDYEGPFTIRSAPSINILQPKAGTTITGAQLINGKYEIKWSSFGAGSTVTIYFTSNGGNNWTIYPNIPNHDGSDNSYSWTVPTVNSTNCYLAIWGGSSNLHVYEGRFTVNNAPRSINIIQPLAGMTLTRRSQVDINWDSQGAGPTVNIYFTSNGGNTWSTIPNVPNHDGRNTYRWTVPDISSTKCFLAIWSNYYNVFDYEGAFTIR
jgi:hypothetical protein